MNKVNTYDCILTLIKRREKHYLPYENWIYGSSFEQTWISFTQRSIVPSLVKIGSVVLEKMKMFTDGQTTDDPRSEKPIWAFSSGELKIMTMGWSGKIVNSMTHGACIIMIGREHIIHTQKSIIYNFKNLLLQTIMYIVLMTKI